jgi:hypothetical protein
LIPQVSTPPQDLLSTYGVEPHGMPNPCNSGT